MSTKMKCEHHPILIAGTVYCVLCAKVIRCTSKS